MTGNRMFKISILLALLALLCTAGAVSAAFLFRSDPIDGSAGIGDQTGAWTQDVSDAYDLAKYGTDSRFNSPDEISAKESRKMLRFTRDITLEKDLVLTNDVGLDLAGHSLNLAGHKLVFRHAYLGELKIRGDAGAAILSKVGEVASPEGKIVVDLPRGYLLPTGLTSSAEYGSFFEVADFSAVDAETKAALAREAAAFAGTLIHGNYLGDIELVTSYLCYDLEFSYQPLGMDGTESPYFDRYGNMLSRPAVHAEGTPTGVPLILRLTISEGGTVLGAPFDLPIVVVSEDVLADCKALGESVLDDYLARYLQNGSYVLNGNILLPQRNGYYGIDFSYSAQTDVADSQTDPGILVTGTSGAVSLNKPDLGSTLTLYPTVTKRNADGTTAFSTPLKGYVFTLQNLSNYEIARQAMETAEEGSGFSKAPFVFYAPTETLTLKGMEQLAGLGVESVSYRLSANNAFIYTKPDGTSEDRLHYAFRGTNTGEFGGTGAPVLTVSGGLAENLPDYTEEIYMEAVFRFSSGSPREVTLRYRIYYSPSDEGGGDESATAYRVQYAEILRLFRERTDGGMTWQSFRMPDSILGAYVYYKIQDSSADPQIAYPAGIALRKTVGGEDPNLFEIDPAALPLEDQQVTVLIKFSRTLLDGTAEAAIDWTKVTRSYVFTLLGVIQNAAGGIPDPALYRAVLDAVHESYLSAEAVLLTGRARSLESLALSGVSVTQGFEGIQLLTGLTSFSAVNCNFGKGSYLDGDFARLAELRLEGLDLSRNGLTGTALAKFSDLFTLTSLTLDGNRFSNLDSLGAMPRLIFLSLRDCGIVDIEGISALDKLEVLDLSNAGEENPNRIVLLDVLLDLGELTRLSVYGNVPQTADGRGDNENEWKYHFTTLYFLSERRVEVLNHYTETAGVRTGTGMVMPAGDLSEYIWVAEGIFHYRWGDGSIILPTALTAADGTVYHLSWEYGGQFTEDPNFSVSGQVRILPNAGLAAGEYFIYATLVSHERAGVVTALIPSEQISRTYPVLLEGGAS